LQSKSKSHIIKLRANLATRGMTTKEHLSKHDREIAAIRVLLKTGISLLNRNQQQISQLIAAQTRTEAALKAFIESRQASNGHSKRKIDLQ
jgi:hypothetical protein